MAVVYYSQQDEYDLVNSGQDCMGWTVVDQAGNEIGTVSEMLINTDTEMVDSILVDRKKRIAAQDFALRDGRVVVRGIMHDGELEMSGAAAGQTHDQPMPKQASEAKHVAGVTRAANEGEVVLPIIEEQLAVGKRTVEKGGARVRTSVSEVPVAESVTLREEHVTVERHKVDRPVDNTAAAFKEGTIEVNEKAEVPVVAKEARVVEEVVVGKQVTEREQTVRDTVKRTEVDVDETDKTDDRSRGSNG
ncbi:MAG: PRC and DUF2382 domain-containing protein [Acidobacteriota bacterium]|nr:PRC and DUF2382 domain-containing protein [Acidobacteriota bacterium]